MSLEVRKLSPELEKVAREELNENPNQIQQNLEQFREWIRKSPHLKSRTDDQFLITFLRGCKYSLEKAKQKLDMYYTLRTHLPELIGPRQQLDAKTLEILKLGVMFPVSKCTPGGPQLVIVRPGAYDADKLNITDAIRAFMLINDIMFTENDNLAVAGVISIVDLKDATLAHLMQMTPSLIKKMTMLNQEGTPMRQKGVHYFNTPPGFEKVFNMFNSFMNEKMRKRVFVHGSDFESLINKGVPKDILPTEYGGTSDSIDTIMSYWEEKIKDNYEKLKDEVTKYGVDEKKRTGKPKNPESLFGVDGTFRKLEID